MGSVKEPNFFIVGAAKAGTTSLWQYLRQHPDVFMPQNDLEKEPTYFSELTPPWATQFRDWSTYLKLFEPAKTQRAIGEASVAYLFSSDAADRIADRYPGARIIIALRHPAERAYSHYKFMCELGFEWLTPFESALAAEEPRSLDVALKQRDPYWFYGYQYFGVGLYAAQIERFTRRFSKEQIQLVFFNELNKRPAETTRAVFEFLGVDPGFVPDFKVHNVSYNPLSVRAQYWLGQHWNLHPVRPQVPPGRLIDKTVIPLAFIANLWFGKLRKTMLDRGTRRRMVERYRDDILRTSDLIGRSLDGWLQEPA